jgi:hypothetical protein
MKETANVATGFPVETFQAPGPIRLRYHAVQPEIERTTMSGFTLSLWIALVIAMLTTAFMTMSMTASLGRVSTKHAAASPAVHSVLYGNAAGHEINADVDAAGYIVCQRGETGIEFLKHKLAIEKERLLLDGMERAKIPAEAKLKIVLSDTKLSVTANGINALRTTIKR